MMSGTYTLFTVVLNSIYCPCHAQQFLKWLILFRSKTGVNWIFHDKVKCVIIENDSS